jgi:hypothetical protein
LLKQAPLLKSNKRKTVRKAGGITHVVGSGVFLDFDGVFCAAEHQSRWPKQVLYSLFSVNPSSDLPEIP